MSIKTNICWHCSYWKIVGLVPDLNPGPLAQLAKIKPLDQWATHHIASWHQMMIKKNCQNLQFWNKRNLKNLLFRTYGYKYQWKSNPGWNYIIRSWMCWGTLSWSVFKSYSSEKLDSGKFRCRVVSELKMFYFLLKKFERKNKYATLENLRLMLSVSVSQRHCFLYIPTRVWMLRTPNAGLNLLFRVFCKFCRFWCKNYENWGKNKIYNIFQSNSCLLLGNKYQRKNYPFFSLFPNAIKQKNVGLAFNKTGENRSKKLKKLVKTRFLRECAKSRFLPGCGVGITQTLFKFTPLALWNAPGVSQVYLESNCKNVQLVFCT